MPWRDVDVLLVLMAPESQKCEDSHQGRAGSWVLASPDTGFEAQGPRPQLLRILFVGGLQHMLLWRLSPQA